MFKEVDFPIHGTMSQYLSAKGYDDAALLEKAHQLYGSNMYVSAYVFGIDVS